MDRQSDECKRVMEDVFKYRKNIIELIASAKKAGALDEDLKINTFLQEAFKEGGKKKMLEDPIVRMKLALSSPNSKRNERYLTQFFDIDNPMPNGKPKKVTPTDEMLGESFTSGTECNVGFTFDNMNISMYGISIQLVAKIVIYKQAAADDFSEFINNVASKNMMQIHINDGVNESKANVNATTASADADADEDDGEFDDLNQ